VQAKVTAATEAIFLTAEQEKPSSSCGICSNARAVVMTTQVFMIKIQH